MSAGCENGASNDKASVPVTQIPLSSGFSLIASPVEKPSVDCTVYKQWGKNQCRVNNGRCQTQISDHLSLPVAQERACDQTARLYGAPGRQPFLPGPIRGF